MEATYKGTKKLAVRNKPYGDVVKVLNPGDSIDIDKVKGGWAYGPEGCVKESFVTIEKEDLESKTMAELRAMAKAKGIKVKAHVTKPELIALIDG